MRIFFDANLLFSGAKSDGAVRQLLILLEKSGQECCVDGYVIEEARRNLVAKAPDRVAALARRLSRLKAAGAQRSDAALEASLLRFAARDRPVLAAAIHQSCGAPVTGDRMHFGALYGRTIHGVATHSPRSLAEALLAQRKLPPQQYCRTAREFVHRSLEGEGGRSGSTRLAAAGNRRSVRGRGFAASSHRRHPQHGWPRNLRLGLLQSFVRE